MTFSESTRDVTTTESAPRESLRARYAPKVLETLTHRQKVEAWVSVIVIGQRSAERTVTCLDRLRQQQRVGFERCEIIVADTGGLSPVHELLPLRVDVELRMAPGCSSADLLNAAVAHSSAPLLVFVDSAAVTAADFLAKALAHFDDPSILAVRARVLPNKHPLLASVAFDFDAGPEPFDDTLVSPHSSVVRSEAFLLAGGFADLPTPLAAVDLALRLRECYPTHRLVYAPDVIMRRDRCESWQELLTQCNEHAASAAGHGRLVAALRAAERQFGANRGVKERTTHKAMVGVSRGVSAARRLLAWRPRRGGGKPLGEK